MACLFQRHNWGWPRRRGERNIQVCITCGSEREALVQFDGPRFQRTQDADPERAAHRLHREELPLANVA